VYGDRLVSYEDLHKYMNLAQTQVKKRFPSYNMGGFFISENADPLIFCHFAESIQDKQYNRVVSIDRLRTTLEEALAEYNEMFVTMNLVLFEDAIKHICRISRIVLNPQGHALLVGVGGSGKQSLSRLSAFVCGYTVVQIVISGTYGISDLKEDIKSMYSKAGLKEEGIMFLFTDSQISNERFLVYINDMLASGNIPDLYAQEEKDEIVNAVASRVKAAGLPGDASTSWTFFMNTVRANLHVVLSFSPVTEEFRTRAKKFPALVNSTVIDWFQPWPAEALYSVGKRFLADVDLGTDTIRLGIEKFLPFSFDLVNRTAKVYHKKDRRFVYTTPKSYLELLKLYKDLLARKRDQMGKSIDRLTNGLAKLRSTAEAVVEIEADLKIKLEDAEQKKTTAEGIATEVSANKAVVEEETAKATVEAGLCAEIQKDVSVTQRSAEEDLAKAEPAVEAAMQALETLNKKELGECKTMLTPPKGVDDVFGAVVVLLAGIEPNVIVQKNGRVKDKDRNWDAAKKALLGNVNAFIDLLKSYKEKVDSYQVSDMNWKEVRQYLELEHFNVDTIASKNKAAAGLCSWVVNIVMYRDILVTVEPKRQALREANERLQVATVKLQAVQAKVADLQATLDRLTKEFDQANAEKQAAIQLVEDGQRRLDLATRLTSALADENVRWALGIETLKAERTLLIGDVLLSSAFISYIGPFTKKYREELMMKSYLPFLETAAGGERIPMSASPDPRLILTDEAQIAQWNSEGLPTDRVSIENACIVTNTARWPLMIDPQLQGISWVREKEKARNLQVVRLGQKNMLRVLERAIDSGQPVLIENMGERIDAVLNPVIARSTIKKGHKQYLMLGDKEVEFHKDFRLYLHTKLSNPHYPPEVQAETALINFTVTEAGLEDQLLSMVVQKERPDLASLRSDLISQQNSFKIKMKQLEDDILQRLANAEGDITSDVELIVGLEDTKRIANDIAEKQKVAKQTEIDINFTSEKYRPVAARGSLIFFLMNELFKVHTYYIYSLSAFVTIFLRAIDVVSGDANPMKEELEEADKAELAAEAEGEGEEGEAAEGAAEVDEVCVCVSPVLSYLALPSQCSCTCRKSARVPVPPCNVAWRSYVQWFAGRRRCCRRCCRRGRRGSQGAQGNDRRAACASLHHLEGQCDDDFVPVHQPRPVREGQAHGGCAAVFPSHGP
jgi:dynein heavy chain